LGYISYFACLFFKKNEMNYIVFSQLYTEFLQKKDEN
jgi:hypothetical protein